MSIKPESTETRNKTINWREIAIGAAALLVTLGLCFLVLYYWEYIIQVKRYGYLGIFIIGIFSSAVPLVPIPGLLFVFTLGSVLIPPLVGVCSGVGEAAGSILIYLTGYGGKGAFDRIKYADKFQGWLKRHGSLSVIIMSAIANPLFMPFTAVAGMMRFGLIKFFLLCCLGKTIKNTAVAYLGFFGLGSLLRWIGVPV